MKELQRYGQSVWLDYIRRSLITGGELRRLLDEDGLRGVTSNPAIFEKAIAGSTDYEGQLKELTKRRDLDAKAAYEILAIHDIQDVADILRPIYEPSGRRDGYVSLEVSPDLAHDTQGTLDEARRLWKAVGRVNVMIKVPATPGRDPGHQARSSATASTSTSRCCSRSRPTRRWPRPTSRGWRRSRPRAGIPSRVESVASFFISRIDSAVDAAHRRAAEEPRENTLEQGQLKGLWGGWPSPTPS